MGGGGECMAKFILISFNLIFLLSGITVLGVGIWVKVDKNIVKMQDLIQIDTNDDTLGKAASVLIGFGCFVLLISALGFFAACTQKKFFIVAYIAFLVIIFIGEFSGGITAAVFKSKIDKELQKILNDSFAKYTPENSLLIKAWDYIQVWLKCCGSNGPLDYMNVTMLSNKTLTVPKSCCVLKNTDPDKPEPKNYELCKEEANLFIHNNTQYYNVYTKGCYSSLEENVKSHLALIIGVGVGIAMLQILGIVLAVCMCKKNKDD